MPSSTPSTARRAPRLIRKVKSFSSKNGLFITTALAIIVVIAGTLLIRSWSDVSKLVSPLEAGKSDTIRIYDKNDKIVCTISGNEDRVPVNIKQIAPFMREAVIAAEDHDFYKHHGVNPESIVRAALVNLRSGRVREGGSTITQQLAKTLYSEGEERNIEQKIKEALIALQLEGKYSKDKILESYLNQVYFGRGAYGVERAAELYFAKPAAKLSLPESAFLAGIINAPSSLSRKDNRDDAEERQARILDQMVEYGYVSRAQATKAKATKLNIRSVGSLDSYYLYYVDAVMDEIKHSLGKDRESMDGFSVYTNMDSAAQKQAVIAINNGVRKAPKGVRQAALVSINVKDGSVLALVGGAGNFWKHQFNRATNPHTVGSAFKPFVYLAGIISGAIHTDTVLQDEPLTITQGQTKPYSPRNFDHEYLGALTVRDALAKSRNVCAVKVAADTGIDKVINVAKEAGINENLEPNLSIALGSCAVSPLEMAAAYSTLARGGVRVTPRLIRSVKDFSGHELLKEKSDSQKVFEKEPVAELVDMMQTVVQSGTATAAKLPGRPVAGKTGTADQSKDLWFVGFTPDMVTATWGGNDENNPIPGSSATGGSVMAGIWKSYNLSYYSSHAIPPGKFDAPETPMDSSIRFIASPDIEGTLEESADRVSSKVEKVEKAINRKKHGLFHSVGKLFKSFFD